MVAQFRAQSAKFLDDPRFELMARGLCEVSEAFRELWQRQVVGDSYHVDVVYDHPALGRLSFDPMVLGVPQFPTLRLFTYLPKSGTGTQAALLGLNRKVAAQRPARLDTSPSITGTGTTARFNTSAISPPSALSEVPAMADVRRADAAV
jgi:hypothetical protein